MSTSKHIDLICAAALLLTLLVTVLFINGKALGIPAASDGGAGDGDGHFAADDLNADQAAAGAARITMTGDGGRVSGSGAYFLNGDVCIVCPGEYVLSGELADGSVIIDAGKEDKIRLLLDGVSLHCEDSAAIVVEQADKVILTLADGTENFVSSGVSYSSDAVSAKIDGAIYSRDDLTINGGGSLTVTAPYKHGIVCNDDLVIAGGTIHITAAQDGVHANDSVSFANADLTVSAGDDGVTVSNDDETAWLYVESGTISILSCYEGLEAIDITIAGGTIDIRPTDDGINANGRGGNSAINITGGGITIINETGRDADGLDSNGSIHISGGNIFISVNTSSCALDYGSENGGVCEISGGTVIAAGGSAMAEGFDSSSEQCFIMYNTSTAPAGTAVTLTNSAGAVLVSETIPCGFSSIVISTPELQMGETCTISIGGSPAEITVDNSSGPAGFGGMGGWGGGNQGGGFGGRGGMGGRRGLDSGETQDSRAPNVSTLSASGSWSGAMDGDGPQRPGDGFPGGGDDPRMPEDGFPDGGDGPQRPEDGFPGGDDGPQVPEDGFPDGGDGPRMPEDGFPDGGDGPRMPEDGFPESGDDAQRPDGFGGGDRFTQWGQTREDPEGGASGVSPDALLSVGVSVLFLLAGLAVAFKVRH